MGNVAEWVPGGEQLMLRCLKSHAVQVCSSAHVRVSEQTWIDSEAQEGGLYREEPSCGRS